MTEILSFSIRVIIVYYFTYLCTRSLSKKSMAQMTANDIAGLMILANVAAEPLVDKVTVKSVYGTGLIVVMMIITTRLALKKKFSSFMEHSPTVIVEKGKLDLKTLNYLGLTTNEFDGLLRQQGYDKISDLDKVIMELQGNLSVFPKAENKPITLKDLDDNKRNIKDNMKASSQGNNPKLTIPIIIDGNIIYSNLKHIQKTKEWLILELKNQGVLDYKKEVGMAELDSSWKLNIYKV